MILSLVASKKRHMFNLLLNWFKLVFKSYGWIIALIVTVMETLFSKHFFVLLLTYHSSLKLSCYNICLLNFYYHGYLMHIGIIMMQPGRISSIS